MYLLRGKGESGRAKEPYAHTATEFQSKLVANFRKIYMELQPHETTCLILVVLETDNETRSATLARNVKEQLQSGQASFLPQPLDPTP